MLVAATGCRLLGPPPAAPPAGMPEPDGPVVQLAVGEADGGAWTYSAYRSGGALCTVLEGGGGGRSGCAGVHFGDGVFGGLGVSGGAGPTFVDGVAAAEVARIVVLTDRGERLEAAVVPLRELGVAGSAFIAVVPVGEPTELVALDEEGAEMGRFPVGGLAPPTPAGPTPQTGG